MEVLNVSDISSLVGISNRNSRHWSCSHSNHFVDHVGCSIRSTSYHLHPQTRVHVSWLAGDLYRFVPGVQLLPTTLLLLAHGRLQLG